MPERICIIKIQYNDLGGIAQLVERLNGIQEVRGSTPLISTIKRVGLSPVLFCFLQSVKAGYGNESTQRHLDIQALSIISKTGF